MYDRTARLSIKGEELNRNTLLERIITLVYKLLIFRESAKIAIKRAQKKMRQDYPV